MGQVFTWGQIVAGEIPREEYVDEVAEHVRRRLYNEPGVTFATMCGSVARGDFTLRSDVDCVVVYERASEFQIRRITNILSVFAAELHVPLSIIPCDVELATMTRFHHMGPAFVRHLASSVGAGGGIKGQEFLERIVPSVSVRDEIESYLRMKLYRLMEASMTEQSLDARDHAKYLKKGLESVMHVARKVLVYNDLLVHDARRDVVERYREVMPEHLVQLFDVLVELDRLYTEEVYAQIDDGLDEGRYNATFSLISLAMPRVMTFIRDNMAHLNVRQ